MSGNQDPYADCTFAEDVAAGPYYFVEGQDRGLVHVAGVAAYTEMDLPSEVKSRAEMLAAPELRAALKDWEAGDRSRVLEYHVSVEQEVYREQHGSAND